MTGSVGTTPPLVELEDICRDFGPTTRVLRDVRLTVSTGERLAIIGASGSGKTMLLSILGLLDRPTSGSYRLAGVETTSMSEKQRTETRRSALSFVFQSFHLIPHLSATENVQEGLRIAGVSGRNQCGRARASLEAVGLGHRLNAFPGTLSGGEQQRVAIARALTRQPRLLLCDEPTGNLDSDNSDQVLDCLVNIPDPRSALILVTHDERVAARCDRQIRVDDGVVTVVR